MATFYRYGTATPVINVDTGLAGTDIQIAAGHKAIIRHIDGLSLAAGNTQLFVNNTTVALVNGGAPSPIWGAARAGIGNFNADVYVYVDAPTVAVNLCLSSVNTTGAVAVAGSFSGIYQ